MPTNNVVEYAPRNYAVTTGAIWQFTQPAKSIYPIEEKYQSLIPVLTTAGGEYDIGSKEMVVTYTGKETVFVELTPKWYFSSTHIENVTQSPVVRSSLQFQLLI